MKIECDKCSAKYSIADEKVRGKTFKIRCKKCSNVIIVRDKGVVSDANASAAVDSGGPGWHLAINGETVGPLGEDEVRQRFAAGEIDKDTAVWQEGFDDWLPLGEVDAFADLPAPGAEDPFAASANQDDYAVGMGRSVGMGAAAAVAATGTDGLAEQPQSPRVSKLTGQRNENSVLFSLDSLQAMATGGAAAARPNVAAPAARASANPSKGLATSAPSSEGSGLIDIRSLGSMVGGGGMAAASAAPQAAADDAALPSFGGGGFGGLGASPLISPTQVAAEAAPPPVVVQQRSNAPLYIMMIVLILAVGGLGAFILLKKPEEPKTIVQEVPIVAPSVKDDDEDDKKKDDEDDKKDDEKKDDEKAADEGGETEGAEAEGGVVGDSKDGTKAGSKKSSGGSSGGSKKSGGSSGTADAKSGSTAGSSGGSTKSGGSSDAPSVDCILDPSKCGSAKKTSGGSSGGSTSGGSTDPGAPEKLSATDIKAGMAGVKDAAKACGPKHGAKPGEKVTVKLSFSGATGTVTKATPLDPHTGTPLGNCVAAALKNAKVIKFKTASQGASYGVTM